MAQDKENRYKSTLNLPQTDFPKIVVRRHQRGLWESLRLAGEKRRSEKEAKAGKISH